MNINVYLAGHPVNSRYGAPMGRDDGTPDLEPAYLQRVVFVDGAYSLDGTYWGGGAPLWCLFDKELSFRVHVRAHTRKEAYAKLVGTYGPINLRRKL